MGLNPAVAFLVLARGSGHDNITTHWSAEAVRRYTSMSWLRAKESLAALGSNKRIVASVTANGRLRSRKLVIPDDAEQWLWLPNALVTGAGDESPPVARLRQSQNLEHLQTFIELYGVQDLAGDGGLPRSLVRTPYRRGQICDYGQFTVYGFNRDETRLCWNRGPLERFKGKGKKESAWLCLGALEDMGLLETVVYLAESDSPEAELLHPLTGGKEAQDVAIAAVVAAQSLPSGFNYEAAKYEYTLPVLRHIGNPAVVGVSRLVYRPHTKLTAAWFAQYREACTAYAARYSALAKGDFKQAA